MKMAGLANALDGTLWRELPHSLVSHVKSALAQWFSTHGLSYRSV